MADDTNLLMMAREVGVLAGQMKEMIHNVNEMRTQMTAVSHIMVKVDDIPATVLKLETALTAMEDKIDQLRAIEIERHGVLKFLGVVFKSPALAWLVTGAGAVYLYLTGKGAA